MNAPLAPISADAVTQLAVLASSPLHNYLPVLILVAMAATFGIFNVGASLVWGRSGPGR